MYVPKKSNLLKKALLFLPVLLVLPFIAVFDTLIYFITRPACLNCGNLVEFLKTSSLSISLISTTLGYTYVKDKLSKKV